MKTRANSSTIDVSAFLIGAIVVGVRAAEPTGDKDVIGGDLAQELRQDIEAIRSSDASVRYAAVERLGKMGEEAIPALPFLTDMLKEEHVWDMVNWRGKESRASINAALAIRSDPWRHGIGYCLREPNERWLET